MIKYIKNKNFISEKFYNKIQKERAKNDNRIIIFFLAINVFFIPISLNHMQKLKKKVNYDEVRMINNSKDSINIQDIRTYIEEVMTDYVDEAYITKNQGEIRVSTLDKVDNIVSHNTIKVYKLELNDNEKYVMGVNLNEKVR